MLEWEYLIIDQRINPEREEPIPFETWELDHRGVQGWELVCALDEQRLAFKRPKPIKPQATTGRVSVQLQGENQMPLTVDSTGQNLEFQFEDDHGDLNIAAPTGDDSGLVITLTSDTPSVATVGATAPGPPDAAGNPTWLAPLTFGVDGSFTPMATVANLSGAPLVDNDGVTPFVQPAPGAPISVAGGQAVTGDVTEV